MQRLSTADEEIGVVRSPDYGEHVADQLSIPKANNQIIAAIARDKGSGPNEETILHQGSTPSPVIKNKHFTISQAAIT